MRDDVHDGPAGDRGGDLPHHPGHLLALGVAVPVVEEDARPGSTLTLLSKNSSVHCGGDNGDKRPKEEFVFVHVCSFLVICNAFIWFRPPIWID